MESTNYVNNNSNSTTTKKKKSIVNKLISSKQNKNENENKEINFDSQLKLVDITSENKMLFHSLFFLKMENEDLTRNKILANNTNEQYKASKK
jgi:hypothetical protein